MVSIVISASVVKGLLLLLLGNVMPKEDFNSWLEKDGFVYSEEKYGNKKFLFDELEKLKEQFKMDIKDVLNQTPEFIYNLINGHKLRIEKVRLMINHKVIYATNLNARVNIRYVLVRGYWIDPKFRKSREFSKNLGRYEDVYVNGKIPESLKREAEQEIFQMMLNRYHIEYPN